MLNFAREVHSLGDVAGVEVVPRRTAAVQRVRSAMHRTSVSLHAETRQPSSATRNACKLCAPLGACLAFRGVEGAIPLLHGSQGCATYIRRYMISHFREPMDIASSNFGETAAIFGGRENLPPGAWRTSSANTPRA